MGGLELIAAVVLNDVNTVAIIGRFITNAITINIIHLPNSIVFFELDFSETIILFFFNN